jgi:hypothetical protein
MDHNTLGYRFLQYKKIDIRTFRKFLIIGLQVKIMVSDRWLVASGKDND